MRDTHPNGCICKNKTYIYESEGVSCIDHAYILVRHITNVVSVAYEWITFWVAEMQPTPLPIPWKNNNKHLHLDGPCFMASANNVRQFTIVIVMCLLSCICKGMQSNQKPTYWRVPSVFYSFVVNKLVIMFPPNVLKWILCNPNQHHGFT